MSFKAEKLLSLASEFEKNASSTISKKADAQGFLNVLRNYERNSEAVKDFAEAMLAISEDYKAGSDMNKPVEARIYELLKKQAEFVAACYEDIEFLDSEMDELQNGEEEPSPDSTEANDLVTTAKDKKLDPKAKVRNRGTVCVPAESAKDKKDHFPINNESQARNALARVNQYSSVPDWYSGSLQSLVSLVARKVKAKYPSIEVSKDAKKPGKKAYLEIFDKLIIKNTQAE